MNNKLTIDEVCERLRISKGKLYMLWREGKGPEYSMVGSERRVSESDLEAWFEANKPGQADGE